MKTILLAAACAAPPLFAQLNADTGNLTVRIVYQGNPVGNCQIEYTTSIGYFQCGGSVTNVPVGTYSLNPNFSQLPTVPVTITKGVTTQLDIEISPFTGLVTGVILVNGTPPPANGGFGFDMSGDQIQYSYTDATGRFQFLAFPGARQGMVAGNTFNPQQFPFTGAVNTTVDVGTIDVTPYVPPTYGSFTVRTLYHGQPVSNCLFLYYDISNGDSANCNDTRNQVTAGTYTLSSQFFPQITPVTFDVIDGQTTSIDVEVSPWLGEITGIILLDGAPPPANTTYAYAEYPSGATRGYSDATGRFRFLSAAGPQTGNVVKDTLLGTFAFTAIAGSTVDVGTISTNHAPVGNITVRPLYKGQPLTNCIGLDFHLDNGYGFGCNGTATSLPGGTYTITEDLHGLAAPVTATVSDGQTTVVDVEISGWAGEITGTIKLNGSIPPPGSLYAMSDYPAFVTRGFTDGTGRFRFLAVAGPGTGFVAESVLLVRFSYTAVAGQTRDLGAVGLTTLNGAITAKNGAMPFKTWTIRLDNTGTLNSADNTQLDNLTFTQTSGAACTPVVTSSFPLVAGYLIPGTSATVQVDINFTGCAANARFTAKLFYSANGGAASNNRSYALQLP